MEYNIYAGLSGSFGGASYEFTCSYDNEYEAESDAYDRACEIYETYEGYHGVNTYEDALNEAKSEADFENEEELNSYADEIYHDYQDQWIDYYVIPTDEDNVPEDQLIRINDDGDDSWKACS